MPLQVQYCGACSAWHIGVSNSPTRHAIALREGVHQNGLRFDGLQKLHHIAMVRSVSHQFRIAFIEDNPDFALQRYFSDAQKRLGLINSPSWIIRTVDDDGLGGRSDSLVNVIGGQFVSGLARIDIHGLGPSQLNLRRKRHPEWSRDYDLVSRIAEDHRGIVKSLFRSCRYAHLFRAVWRATSLRHVFGNALTQLLDTQSRRIFIASVIDAGLR